MSFNEKLKIMREGGKILSSFLDELESMVEPNLATIELENKFIDLCKKHNVIPACKGYPGRGKTPFPTGLCLGINNECVHCYPKDGDILKEGDITVLDSVIIHDGYHVDSARTVAVGKVSEERERLLNTTKMARSAAINVIKPEVRVGDISNAIQTVVEMAGFNVLRGFTGHGVGEEMHEFPNIPCHGNKGTGPVITEGMTLAIEPLVSSGGYNVVYKSGSDWETYLEDGSDFAQFEHTIYVGKKGAEILTI